MRKTFWKEVKIPGSRTEHNQSLQQGERLSDFLEFAELMATDALERTESCGCSLRSEFQTDEGEAQRDDKNFSCVFAWEYSGPDNTPVLKQERLEFENVELTQRCYK